MITEDYVSFETAKLLKEKGFREWCSYCYGLDVRYNGESIGLDEEAELKEQGLGDEIEYIDGGRLYHFGCDNRNEGPTYAAPSLYVAMKWLREVHKIAINIGWGEVFEENYQWWCIILNQNSGEILRESEYCKTYEQACEAAIKYCLENLI